MGVLEYDDMLELRRASDEISSKIVTYVNHIAEHLPGVSEPPLSMLDAFPELELVTKHTDEKLAAMDAKIDRVLRHLNVEDSI